MTDNVENIRMDEYLYSLPSERIAQQPVSPPEAAKLLVWQGNTQQLHDSTFAELRTWLPAASTLVFNDTKVVPARIVLYKKSGFPSRTRCAQSIRRSHVFHFRMRVAVPHREC